MEFSEVSTGEQRSSISSVVALSKMQKGLFRRSRGKLRSVRKSCEYVYRKFSGSTSARAHRQPHHVDFKPSLICASSRTNFPLSLYPDSPSPSRARAHARPRSLLLSLSTRISTRACVDLGVPRTLFLSFVPSSLPDFFPYLFVSSSFFPYFSPSPTSSLSSFFDVSRSVHGVDTCARLLRDLHRRMCWDNLVVIVLSPLVPRLALPLPSKKPRFGLFSLASIRGGSRMDGRKNEIFSFRKKRGPPLLRRKGRRGGGSSSLISVGR